MIPTLPVMIAQYKERKRVQLLHERANKKPRDAKGDANATQEIVVLE